MKITGIFLLSLSITACNEIKHPPKNVLSAFKTGVYTSAKIKKTDWIPLAMSGYTSCFMGTELTINKDASFQLKTCGAIETGTWQYKADSLYLFAKTIKWKNDSLQQHGFEGKWLEVPKKPEVFHVLNEGTVLKEDVYRKNGKKYLNMLVLQQ